MIPMREPIKVLGDVLKSEMGIIDAQIMLGLENYRIPKTRGLYVALLYGIPHPIGSNNRTEDIPGSMLEIQEVAMMHEIVIEAMSFNDEARLRKEEILQALGSIAAQNAMDLYGMKIYNLPVSFLPVPSLETTKQLNRFHLTFNMNALHVKTKVVPFYETFPAPEVLTNA